MYKEDVKYHFLLFLLSPVLGLIYSLRTRSEKVIRWTLFAFTVVYGSLFKMELLGDGARHWHRVYIHYQYLSFDVWFRELIAILSLSPMDTTNDDVYIHTLSYFIGGVLNLPGLFFVAVAIVYGYFYSGTIVKLLSYVNWRSNYNKKFIYFFLFVFLLWKQPLDMQTVRSWTSMWVILYSVISYHQTKKLKYILLSFTVPFIHIGFTALALPFWIVLLSGYRKPRIYFYIFVFSIFSSTLLENSNIMTQISSGSKLGENKTEGYFRTEEEREEVEEDKDEMLEGKSFYHVYASSGFHKYALTGMIFFIYFILRKRGFSSIENTLFSYGLAIASFANFCVAIFAIHNRGWLFTAILILPLILIFLSKQNLKNISFNFLKVRLPLFIFSILLIPYIFFCLSNFIRFTSPYIFLMPVVCWIEPEAAIGIREIIGLFM